MELNYIINEIDRTITATKTELVFLEERKDALLRLNEQYPGAHYEHNSICLDDIWEKVSCMRIYRKYRYYYSSKVNVRFLLGKKDMTDDIKIHTYPYDNTVADITVRNTGNPRSPYVRDRIKEINVLNYNTLIPDKCPKKKVFMKRIRKYIVNLIVKENLVILDNSYNIEEFRRLLLLR